MIFRWVFASRVADRILGGCFPPMEKAKIRVAVEGNRRCCNHEEYADDSGPSMEVVNGSSIQHVGFQVPHREPNPGRRYQLDQSEPPVLEERFDASNDEGQGSGDIPEGGEPAVSLAELRGRRFDVSRISVAHRAREHKDRLQRGVFEGSRRLG